jgi:hypothetical protein
MHFRRVICSNDDAMVIYDGGVDKNGICPVRLQRHTLRVGPYRQPGGAERRLGVRLNHRPVTDPSNGSQFTRTIGHVHKSERGMCQMAAVPAVKWMTTLFPVSVIGVRPLIGLLFTH